MLYAVTDSTQSNVKKKISKNKVVSIRALCIGDSFKEKPELGNVVQKKQLKHSLCNRFV